SAVLRAVDAVGADNGADRLAELERRASGIGADIVEGPHFERGNDAALIEGNFQVEIAFGSVRVTAAHVLEPVLDQAHGKAEPAREVSGQHRMFDAALDPVTAADIDIVVHPDRRTWDPECKRDLLGKARHLHRSIDVENLAPWVPIGQYRESLERYR